MIAPVFNKEDFKLCRITVPQGYPQSLTHAGIAYFDHKYYLTCSPYPVKKFSWIESHWHSLLHRLSSGKWGGILDAEKYENPLLFIGTETDGNPPIFFSPAQPFPLMDTPKPMYGLPAYNSDPDIFIEDGRVFILNRTYYRKPFDNGSVEREVIISLICGSVGEKGFLLEDIVEFKKSNMSLISPCLIKHKGMYLFAFLETNCAIDGLSFNGLFVQRSNTIQELSKEKSSINVVIENRGLLPWHMSLFSYQGRLFAIVACVCRGDKSRIWQFLAEFTPDLSGLHIYPKPLTDFNSYRGAATVVDDTFILYSTTLNEKIYKSKSVDGRDIIMSSMPICSLMHILEQAI